MKFFISSFLAVALFAFPNAMAGDVFEYSDVKEYVNVKSAGTATVTVDEQVVFDNTETRRLQSRNQKTRKLPGDLFPGIIDNCPQSESKYVFQTFLFDGNGDLVSPATGGFDSGFFVVDTCTGIQYAAGTTTAGTVELCVPDGHLMTFAVVGTMSQFLVQLNHFNDQNTIGTSFDGDHIDVPGGSSVWGTFIQTNDLSFADNSILTVGPFNKFVAPVGETVTVVAAVLETRIGDDTCNSQTAPDPHFKTFSGDWFDFHGGCDIVLIDVPDYANQSGLAINIRTTVRYAYSFIETIAIKVGEDILQVLGWGDYILNGVSNADLEGATLNGLPVTREVMNEKQYKFVVNLENGHHFTIKVFKDMISTTFDLPQENNVRGILGDKHGAKRARDGVTIIEDANEFGQEWQVQDTDNQLFLTVREPQFPTKCIMPDPVEREKRRLSATVSQEAAEAACSHIKDEHVRDMCIFDVISVDDLSLAAGAY